MWISSFKWIVSRFNTNFQILETSLPPRSSLGTFGSSPGMHLVLSRREAEVAESVNTSTLGNRVGVSVVSHYFKSLVNEMIKVHPHISGAEFSTSPCHLATPVRVSASAHVNLKGPTLGIGYLNLIPNKPPAEMRQLPAGVRASTGHVSPPLPLSIKDLHLSLSFQLSFSSLQQSSGHPSGWIVPCPPLTVP